MSLCMQMGCRLLSLLRGPLRAGMRGAKHVTIAMHGCKTKLAATQRSSPILSRYAAPHLLPYTLDRKPVTAALPTQCHMQGTSAWFVWAPGRFKAALFCFVRAYGQMIAQQLKQAA